MAKTLMIFAMLFAFLFALATSRCMQSSRCTIRSKLRNSVSKYSSQSLLRVKTNGGQPTGIDFKGQNNDGISTEFKITRCTRSASNGFDIIVTVHWRHDQSYALAVKSSSVIIEKTTQIGDSNRFLVSSAGSVSCGSDASCATYESIAAIGKYISVDLSGSISMTSSTSNRGTGLLIHCK